MEAPRAGYRGDRNNCVVLKNRADLCNICIYVIQKEDLQDLWTVNQVGTGYTSPARRCKNVVSLRNKRRFSCRNVEKGRDVRTWFLQKVQRTTRLSRAY